MYVCIIVDLEHYDKQTIRTLDMQFIEIYYSFCCWSFLYSGILRSRADSLLSHVILHEWLVFL